jgi:hypothetical protein
MVRFYSGVTVVLQLCHSGVIVEGWKEPEMVRTCSWCHRGVTVVLQGFYSGDSAALWWCYGGIRVVL